MSISPVRKLAAIALVCAVAPVALTAFAQDSPAPMHTADSLATVKAAVEKGTAILLDVRSQKEWDAGHVKGAIFLPWLELEKTQGAPFDKLKLDKSKTIYTYCHVGIRSLKAATMFKARGYDVRALKPGFADLIDAGLPEETGKK